MVAGPQVMKGYLGNQELTDSVIKETDGKRWYVTGDKGSVDEDNFLHIEDRYARFAKISGEMIGLGTVERILREVLNDEEIEILAINVPDPKKGEMIVILTTHELEERGNYAPNCWLVDSTIFPCPLPTTPLMTYRNWDLAKLILPPQKKLPARRFSAEAPESHCHLIQIIAA